MVVGVKIHATGYKPLDIPEPRTPCYCCGKTGSGYSERLTAEGKVRPKDQQGTHLYPVSAPPLPGVIDLTATEWHAFGYGLKEGLWFWKRTPLAWDEIKKMEALPDDEKLLSPELISALKEKYHYYIIGFALPEDCALLATGVYLLMTNMPGLVQHVLVFFGYSG
ncbi:MAG: hypothetical protein NTZ39_01270 [Methanoregula sp.]|nr:hypothetical protein [Methanoregula sp.]